MSDTTYPNKILNQPALLDDAAYQKMYQQSITEPHTFWAEQAQKFISFSTPWNQVFSGSINDQHWRWFEGAELNACYNCVDRHLAHHADTTALIYEHDKPGSTTISYRQLHQHVCKLANVLLSLGIKKGDRVCIYLPMSPEAVYVMLACARIGAIHSVVFAGFSAESLKNRIIDANCKLVISRESATRGGKTINLFANVKKILSQCPSIAHALIIHDTPQHNTDNIIDYHHAVNAAADDCPCTPMQAEDPLFILYTSGSTGNPKGILHTTAGYLVYVAMSFHYVFNYQLGDIYWCSADIGWVTGHSYIVYGPLANAATQVIFAGVPNYPDYSRCWQIIDKHNVNIFYTAPTAIRALMREGDEYVTRYKRSSLKLLGTVGEPINPEAWRWYYKVVGNERCPIVDTWWQTETGGTMITPLPNVSRLKPGAASKPYFGIQPILLDDTGQEITGPGSGQLAIKQCWPSMLRDVWKDHQRFIDTYLTPFPGYYYTGDKATRDQDGDLWISGRADDVIIVSGHNLGSAEIESALVSNPKIAEAAVVAVEDPVKGQGIYAFVTLMAKTKPDHRLLTDLNNTLQQAIGPIAKIDHLQLAPHLPKTRSGKIMRRILRKIANNETSDLGDTSTLAEADVIKELIRGHQDRA